MFWADQAAILERVAAGHPLGEILSDIVLMIERQAAGMSCSILLLDEDRSTIRHGAAPSLPEPYAKLLDGLKIGPAAGSCGTAAYLKERVIVEDIATHPYWDGYRELALPFGLRACWSSPIFSAEREVLGTFAMYYAEPRGPSSEEIGWVDAATHLAAITIVSEQAARSLRRSEARAKHLARLYAMSSAINEAIVRERDVVRLYDVACRIAVQHGIAKLAWIAVFDKDTGALLPVAHAGVPGDGLRAVSLGLAKLLRGDTQIICNDIEAEAEPAWRSFATELGVRAFAVLPMRSRVATASVLFIGAEHKGAFGDEEADVLVALAEDIAFAVESASTAAELRRSEERLRTMVEHTPDVAIQWYDEDGRIIFYNQATSRLFGWSERGALGKTLVELGFWSADEEARFTESRHMARDGQQVTPMQFRFRRQDGAEGTLLSTVFRIPLSDSDHCYVCMDVDLTAFRKVEAAVRAGESMRAQIYDCVTDAVFFLAVEGVDRYRFQSVNRAFLETTGLAEQAVVGRLVEEVVSEASLALVKAKYAEAIATRGRVRWEEVFHGADGVKHGEVTVGPVLDSEGSCTHLVGTIHEVTWRRQAELERRQVEGQLQQGQRLQSLGTLAGGIAHDFNNILMAIHGNLDLALGALHEGHQARANIVEVKRAAERATSLVRQILTFGRKSEPRCESLELAPVVDEALKLMSSAVKGRVTLRTSFGEGVPPILGDSTQVHQVVMNLVTNAVHAIGEAQGVVDVQLDSAVITLGQRSDLSALKEGVYARLTVSDSGPGMDARTLQRVFEPFFTTKAPGDGTGLGLAVVHGIVKSHGGAIAVRSQVGKGTTFEAYFPASPAVPARDTAPPAQHRAAKRVLFVDDDEAIVFLAQRAFSRLGHSISAHTNPVEALRAFKEDPSGYDVVVTDLSMPQLDGRALIQELRRARADVKIVATSGYVGPEVLEIVRDLGAAQILQKPQSLDDLAKLVEMQFG